MRKDVLLCSIALALLGAGTAQAASDDHFYVGANVGQANYPAPYEQWPDSTRHMDRQDLAYGIRFGYRWSGPVEPGVEAGFTDLGRMSKRWFYYGGLSIIRDTTSHARLSTKAFTLGLTGRHAFGTRGQWLVSARGGVLRAHSDLDLRSDTYWDTILGTASGFYSEKASQSDSYTSWYAGVGVGYRITPELSLSLAYDSYRLKTSYVTGSNNSGYPHDYRHSVGVSSLYLEYGF